MTLLYLCLAVSSKTFANAHVLQKSLRNRIWQILPLYYQLAELFFLFG